MSQARPTEAEANKYAENYVLYGEQSRAWRTVFTKSKACPEVVHSKASLFHKKEKVQKRIAELQQMCKGQTSEEFDISVSELKQMLVKGAKMGLDTKIDALGNSMAINIAGTVSAISEINRMDGNHRAEQVDHNVSIIIEGKDAQL